MSRGVEDDVRVPAEWDELELTVRRLLDDYERWHRRAVAAEARVRELQSALNDVSSGAVDPLELRRRVEQLEARNALLTERLHKAHGNVSRILDRLDFAGEPA